MCRLLFGIGRFARMLVTIEATAYASYILGIATVPGRRAAVKLIQTTAKETPFKQA